MKTKIFFWFLKTFFGKYLVRLLLNSYYEILLAHVNNHKFHNEKLRSDIHNFLCAFQKEVNDKFLNEYLS
jgi:hypothetical protein